ncbi:urea ABC transporter substrate-binding protein [Oscillatoriales cyanobacterium LEGE 11467]|uniref:Urea ABC transporter substrate-binding protein n=1 Tax=Zarconia navalis LEGE 11467 TaxID=1828826 RepID=A0A928VWJ1_9CYAN|nr:urea ABC transporter substrate-binding protein [Zarconia navalis]MBE9039463.1 urea ABC transporter substrate-binding protein [Zarconia navalis LEGE 11467]
MSQLSSRTPVRVGILHSLTGTMAISEMPLKDAALMAISEIDRAGGVLGRSIEPIVEDGASEPTTFARKAVKLLERDKVASIFGCWTSACRKSLVPIFEQFNSLLWYPVQYEGLESSPNVFYTGACANQQVEPAIRWLLANQYRRFYLLGSDYVFPRTVNKIIKAQVNRGQGKLVRQEYVPLGNREFERIIRNIQATQPDVVVNTLNGDSNVAFYHQYYDAGIRADRIPIFTISVSEHELQSIDRQAIVGHYGAWGYFQSIDTPENKIFVRHFKARYGASRVTSDPIQAAYMQVYLWKQAVEKAGSFEIDAVRKAAIGLKFRAPEGIIQIEPNHHVRQTIRIGRILPTKQFKILYTCDRTIEPQPWLGVEKPDFTATDVIIDLLSEVPQSIQYSCELKEKSNELMTANIKLKETLSALQAVQSDRQKALEKLEKANQKITTLNHQLRSENSRLSAEVEVTRKLQQMLLPTEKELKEVEGLEIAGFMEPADEVGGDYYDVLQHNGRVKITIGDVTGHGLESGVLSLMIQTAVRTLLESKQTDPRQFLDILNRTIYGNIQRIDSYKSITLSILDYHDRQLCVSGQHEEAIVVREGGRIERIDTLDLGLPLGLNPDITEFINCHSIELNPGDAIVLYTDGITEAENSLGQFYGIERLCQTISSHWNFPASEIREAIVTDIRRHIGTHKVYDDIALLVLKQKSTH